MKATKPITVLLAEDHKIVREGLRAILSAEADIDVVAEAANGRSVVELALKFKPDVVVMDIAMPLLNGLEATRQILKRLPATKILVLSAHSDNEYIERVMALGAVGYLIKQSSAEFLSKAIRAAHNGHVQPDSVQQRQESMKANKPITVLLAEDHMIVRQGLRAILSAELDIDVVAEAANGRIAVELAQKLKPDVIVMDIAMPLLNGLEATRQILKLMPAAKILVLSAHSDDEYIDRVLAFGAVGYLIKQSSAEFLSKAIREAHKGHLVFSPKVSKRLRDHPFKLPLDKGELVTKKAARLTSREVELVQLVAEGKANKQIALELDISIKTVEKHRQAVMEKLDIHDTAGLTRYAIAAGIIESSVQVTVI